MKSIPKFYGTICLSLLLGGFGIVLGVGEPLKYGDEVYIKNVVINKYATRDGNILVGKKELSREASFRMVADLDDLNMNKGKEIKYGNPIYFLSSTSMAKDPRFIGDSKKKYRIYLMNRTLLGVVPIAQREKIYKFSIWPPAGTKKAEELAEEYGKTEHVTREPIFYKEEVNIGYYNPDSESPYKSFRFNIDRSTYEFGTEVFISDDSKAMTKKAIIGTKKIIIQKASGK